MQSKSKSNRENKKVGISLRQMNRPRLVQKMTWVAGSALTAVAGIGLAIYLLFANVKNTENTAVTTGDFRSKTSGNWNSTSTWEMYDGAKWVNAISLPAADKGMIAIMKGHTVKVTSNITIDQAQIEEGGKLECQNGNYIYVENGEGTDLNIKGALVMGIGSFLSQKPSSSIDVCGLAVMSAGSKHLMGNDATITLKNGGIFTNNGGTLTTDAGKWIVNAGATYMSSFNGDNIPFAAWNAGSACEITGVTTSKPGNLSQAFYNLIWNCENQTEAINLAGNVTKINGDLTFISSGKSTLGLGNSENYTLNIGGNLNMFGGNVYQCASSKNAIINISGNYKQSGGTFVGVKAMESETTIGMPVINVSGNFSISEGSFDMTQNNATVKDGGICMLNIGGNFSQTGGLITETAPKTNITDNNFGYGQITFNRSGKQIFSKKSGNISNAINFQVNSGSTLDLGESNINGNGNFTLMDNGGLIIGSHAGITSSSANGNIQVTGIHSFSAKANYTYKGDVTQVTGDGLPLMVNNFTISNAHHVTLTNKVSVSGILSLDKGQVITGPNELTVTNPAVTSITGFSIRNYVRGNLRRYVNSSGAYDFPIGTVANYEYMSVNLSNISGCTNLLASFINASPVERSVPLTGIAVNGTIIDNALNYGYWTLTPNAAMTSGTYGITLREKGHSNSGSNTSGYCVLTRPSGNAPWQSPGTHVITSQVEGDGAALAMRAGLSSFAQFAIGSGSTTPAIAAKTVSFDAKINNGAIELTWAGVNGDNNDSYTIERSTDGIRFDAISTKQGNSGSAALSYTDAEPQSQEGNVYYRLKHTDDNGHISYSEVRKMKYTEKTNATSELKLASFTPNPFSDTFTASFELKTASTVDFQLVNSEGRIVFEKKVNAIDGMNRLQYIDEKGLPGGIYFLTLICNGEKISQKILKK